MFKSKDHFSVDEDRSFENVARANVFKSEVEAFKIAFNSKRLNQYIPKYFGEVKVSKVIGLDGNDISNQFLLDCCYSLEYIPLDFKKINDFENYIEISNLFESEGIHFTRDSSYAQVNSSGRIIVIDFAIKDAYNETELNYL